ncbi:hypothetical protein LFM09_42680 [Lentzea alba]|uniref:hypothetical protein n=1 Tax=Lentzea alba TaxID=2714351 RepID=UPI0039BF62AB
MNAPVVDLWLEVDQQEAVIETDGMRETVDFVAPVDEAELGTLTSPLVFKQTSGNVESDFARDIGTRLFGAVFAAGGARVYAHAIGAAEQLGVGVRFRVVVGTPALQALPWELLYDREIHRDFLALTPKFSVVRQLRRVTPTSAPTDKPGVLVVGTGEDLALWSSTGAAADVVPEIPASDELSQVLHLVPRSVPLDTREVFKDLSGRRPPRLLIVDGFPTDLVAAELAAQVPAVLGFRTGSDKANRNVFMSALCSALADHGDVEWAVAAGRGAVDVAEPGRPDWSFPVFYRAETQPPPVQLRLHPRPRADEPARREPAAATPLRPELQDQVTYLELRLRITRENIDTLVQRWPSQASMPDQIRAQLDELRSAETTHQTQLAGLT